MKKYVIIEADTNDADYILGKSKVNDETILLIEKVCKVLKADGYARKWGTGNNKDKYNNPNRFIKSGELTEDDIEIFESYLPYGDNGIHSIQSVEIIIAQEEIKLLYTFVDY